MGYLQGLNLPGQYKQNEKVTVLVDSATSLLAIKNPLLNSAESDNETFQYYYTECLSGDYWVVVAL